jgi:hypothetical protein
MRPGRSRRPLFSTVVVVIALAALATGGPAATTAEVEPVAWTDELGDDARPGPLLYVALGDSFSSGEGTPFVDPNKIDAWVAQRKYEQCVLVTPNARDACVNDRPGEKEIENGVGWLGETGTDVTRLAGGERTIADLADSYSFGGNNCHRSAHAYAPRVWGRLDQQDPNWGLSFAACSGALTAHYRQEFRGEAGQEDAFLAGPADLVTLGFGGNDVGFGDVVQCVLKEAAVDRGLTVSQLVNPVTRFLADRLTEIDVCKARSGPGRAAEMERLGAELAALYDDIRQSPGRLKPGGRVIAIGYPRLFPADPPASCSLGSGASVGRDTMLWLNEFADDLNATIETTAAGHGVEYVNTADIISVPDQNGTRHDFCVDDDRQRWVNRLIPSDLRRSMHPTFPYHERVTERVLACWARTADCTAVAR